MRAMKRHCALFSVLIRRALFLGALSIPTFLISAYGQAGDTVNGLRLLQPSDSSFEPMLEAQFPGLSSTPAYGTLRPFLCLLTNIDNVSRTAYAVKWTVTFTDRPSQFLERVEIRDRFNADIVSLRPGETRIISPFFSYIPSVFRQLSNASEFYMLAEAFPEYPTATGIIASLDGAVSGDDEFAGPDTLSLKLRYACDARAAADEGLLVTTMLATGLSMDEISAQLSAQVLPGVEATGEGDAQSLFIHALGHYGEALGNLIRNTQGKGFAERVAAMRQTGGRVRSGCPAPSALIIEEQKRAGA